MIGFPLRKDGARLNLQDLQKDLAATLPEAPLASPMVNICDEQVARIRSAISSLHGADQSNAIGAQQARCFNQAENAFAYIGQQQEIIDGVQRLQESIAELLAERNYDDQDLPSQRYDDDYYDDDEWAEGEADNVIPIEQPFQQPVASIQATNDKSL